MPLPLATAQNADKASEAARPIPRQGHSIVHASDACGNRQRPTGRALPQAERRATPQEIGKGADVAPAAPEVRERGPRATECATAGRGVATPRRRAKVHRRPPGAQCCALAQREIVAAAACGQNREPLWRWKMPFSVTHPFCCVRPSRPSRRSVRVGEPDWLATGGSRFQFCPL